MNLQAGRTDSGCPDDGLKSFDVMQSLLALKDQIDRLACRRYHADHHGSIGGQGVALKRHCAGLRGGHFQDVVIPLSLGFEITGLNCGAVLAVCGAVVVKNRFRGALIHETAGDDDNAPVIVDAHGAGLNHGLARKIALGRNQFPSPV